MTIAQPCALQLVSLRADETCPRCGQPAGRHRGHQSDQGETMTETTEPTREKIAQWLAQAEANDWGADMSTDDQVAVLRLALRTLDAEWAANEAREDLAAMTRLYNTAWPALDSARAERDAARADLAAMTERAEKVERERAAAIAAGEDIERQSAEVSDLLTELFVTDGGDERDDLELVRGIAREADALRAKLADAERRLAEVGRELSIKDAQIAEMRRALGEKLAKLSNMHRRAQRAESATAAARREAIGQRMRADWWRCEAKRLGWTPDYPELREEPPSDERLDFESSSLLLLSTWARRVMTRPKNRAKGLPSSDPWDLLGMVYSEFCEAREALHCLDDCTAPEHDAMIDEMLSELGDVATCVGFLMREIESRRNR